MPIYSYTCRKCGYNFDVMTSIAARDVLQVCRKCGHAGAERLLSVFSVGASGRQEKNPCGETAHSCTSCPHGSSCGIG